MTTDSSCLLMFSSLVTGVRIFGQSSGELQKLSEVPVDLFRRFATEIGLAVK